jgi:hypothetical protein
MAIGIFLWPFGIFGGRFEYFPLLVCCTKKKSGNPVMSPAKETKMFLALNNLPYIGQALPVREMCLRKM